MIYGNLCFSHYKKEKRKISRRVWDDSMFNGFNYVRPLLFKSSEDNRCGPPVLYQILKRYIRNVHMCAYSFFTVADAATLQNYKCKQIFSHRHGSIINATFSHLLVNSFDFSKRIPSLTIVSPLFCFIPGINSRCKKSFFCVRCLQKILIGFCSSSHLVGRLDHRFGVSCH